MLGCNPSYYVRIQIFFWQSVFHVCANFFQYHAIFWYLCLENVWLLCRYIYVLVHKRTMLMNPVILLCTYGRRWNWSMDLMALVVCIWEKCMPFFLWQQGPRFLFLKARNPYANVAGSNHKVGQKSIFPLPFNPFSSISWSEL